MPEKSTNEKWKFAYKLAVALVPAAVELCGFPKTLELLEKPLSALIEHLASESVDWLFKEQGELEKTAVIIGNALKKLLEDERYNYLETFFESVEFDFSKVNLVSGKDELAEHFCDRFMEWSRTPLAQKSMNQQFMYQFTADLFAIVKENIKPGSSLDSYWLSVNSNEKITEVHNAVVKDPNNTPDYLRAWNDRCCLHDDSQANVTLSTIFVMPEVEIEEKRYGIDVLVKAFLKEDKDDNKDQNILLLLGHGGYGKTSFVAHMAANTSEYTSKPLHIFRLRNFSKAEIGDLREEIEALSNGNLDKDAIVVFDGLDELCMIGGRSGEEQKKATQLMVELVKFWRERPARKLIVTSRPNYVDVGDIVTELNKQIPLGKRKPVLQSYEYAAFDVRQREQLVDKLEKADPALRGNTGCSYIRQMDENKDDENEDDENEDDPIYSSPFILYLICAGGDAINEKHFQNRWLLFRTVFHDVLFNPAYRNGDNERDRFFREHRDKLYYITCCLAYEIYKSGYKIPYFQREDVLNIIRAIYPEETKSVAFANALCDCHALCTYFQKNENGAIEFAHNHVRDFFLCEYILQGLDDLYAERGKGKSAEECGKLVADWLSDNFKYAGTMPETDNFLALAAQQKKTACPHVEQYFKADELKHVFDIFCQNGGLHEYHAEQMNIKPKQASTFVVRNTTIFFKHLFFYQSIPSTIKWFSDLSLYYGARGVVEAMKWLENAHLEDIILDNANLMTLNFKNSSLYHAHLNEANLRDANLFGTNLMFAYLNFAILRDADLRGANLRGANLSGADLRGANLINAIYNDQTIFTNVIPSDFDPEKAGMLKI